MFVPSPEGERLGKSDDCAYLRRNRLERGFINAQDGNQERNASAAAQEAFRVKYAKPSCRTIDELVEPVRTLRGRLYISNQSCVRIPSRRKLFRTVT